MQILKRLLLLSIILMVIATGCGQKNSDDVVNDLEKKMESLTSYKAIGTMKIQTGENPQEYSVEVWYKAPHYYRVSLNNVNTKVTQIVLRNDEGVFVLDPSLNKSYRFKSDWPQSSGAVYLFHSLAMSIIDDKNRTFSLEEDNYLLEVKANYQNQTLSKQKVWLDKELRPIKVTVFDPKETQLIQMDFSEFDFNVKFDDDAFDMKRNLTSWDLDSLVPTGGNSSDDFGIIEPAYTPEGIVKHTPKIINDQDGRKIVIKYTGEFNYNLIESAPKSINVSAPEASKTDIIDLGFGIAVLTELTETRTLAWSYGGIDFKLTGDLPPDEMVSVAKSVFGQSGK